MWISKVRNKATGKIFKQLQYEQVMNRKIEVVGWTDCCWKLDGWLVR